MWLLRTEDMKLCEFYEDIPKYAILSHRWEKEELSFEKIGLSSSRSLKGYHKVKNFCEQAQLGGFRYVWVDTCCINKLSSAELSEAINSMYRWYEEAEICYVYLADVFQQEELEASAWFSRGWTLQELLAPREVHFFNHTWDYIASRQQLATRLEEVTKIPRDVLCKSRSIHDFCIAEKMSWSVSRDTARVEDRAYCLLGISDVNMPLLYEEGDKAFQRLQEEIMKVSTDMSLFLWQGRPCEKFGMLSHSPSCFVNIPKHLMHPAHRDKFMLLKGWTVNNAGISLRGRIRPYCLTRNFEEIYILLLHHAPYNSSSATLGIFVERSSNFWEDSTFRRIASIDDMTWAYSPDGNDTRQYWPVLFRSEQVFITRTPLIEHDEIVEVQGIELRFDKTKPLACTACGRTKAAYNTTDLCTWLVICETSSGSLRCYFETEPCLMKGILGHVVISVAENAEVLICLGFDDRFQAICVVVPFSKQIYDEGLWASAVIRAYYHTRQDNGLDTDGYNTDTHTLIVGGRHEGSYSSSRLGLNFKIYRGLSKYYEARITFNVDMFFKSYLPNLDPAEVGANNNLTEGSIEQVLKIESILNEDRWYRRSG